MVTRLYTITKIHKAQTSSEWVIVVATAAIVTSALDGNQNSKGLKKQKLLAKFGVVESKKTNIALFCLNYFLFKEMKIIYIY